MRRSVRRRRARRRRRRSRARRFGRSRAAAPAGPARCGARRARTGRRRARARAPSTARSSASGGQRGPPGAARPRPRPAGSPGSSPRERRDQRVAAGAVDRRACGAGGGRARRARGSPRARAARRPGVPRSSAALASTTAGGQPFGHDHPAEPQPRRERLADRAGVERPGRARAPARRRPARGRSGTRRRSRPRARRAGAGGPVEQRGAALGREHHAERELVRRRDERPRPGRARSSTSTRRPSRVHRDRHELEAVRGQLLAAGRARRVLHPDAARAAGRPGRGRAAPSPAPCRR